MALAEVEALPTDDDVPVDAFRVRIAIVRAERGWNYTEAGEACNVDGESWRRWEKTGRRPRDYEDVCGKISQGAHYSKRWLMAGGPLRSRWFMTDPLLTSLPLPPQAQLELLDNAGIEWNRRPELSLVDR